MTMGAVETPMIEYLFSLYDTPVRFVTSSSLLATPVNEFLSHFRQGSRVLFQAESDNHPPYLVRHRSLELPR